MGIHEEIVKTLTTFPKVSSIGLEQNDESNPDSDAGDEQIISRSSESSTGQSETFDPAIHAVNSDGTPRTKKDGSFWRKGGRKPSERKTENQKQVESGYIPPEEFNSEPGHYPEARATAVTVTQLLFSTTRSLLGPEWKPDREENELMTEGWTKYFYERGAIQTPPWILILTAGVSYASKRVHLLKNPDPEKQSGLIAWFRKKTKKKDNKKPDGTSTNPQGGYAVKGEAEAPPPKPQVRSGEVDFSKIPD